MISSFNPAGKFSPSNWLLFPQAFRLKIKNQTVCPRFLRCFSPYRSAPENIHPLFASSPGSPWGTPLPHRRRQPQGNVVPPHKLNVVGAWKNKGCHFGGMSPQVDLWRNPRFSTEPAHCWEQGTEVDCNCNLSSISRCLTSPKTSSGDDFDASQFCTWVGFCWGRIECHVSVSMASFFDILGHKMSFNQGQSWSKPTGNQLPYHCHPAMEKILQGKKKHGECIIIYSWWLFPAHLKNMLVKMEIIFPNFRGENNTCLKPLPR